MLTRGRGFEEMTTRRRSSSKKVKVEAVQPVPKSRFELTAAQKDKKFQEEVKSYFVDPNEEPPPEIPQGFKLPKPVNLYAPQLVKSRFNCFGCFPGQKFAHAMNSFTKASLKAESYWDEVEDVFHSIKAMYSFRVPPKKTSIMTQMSAQLWIAAYCSQYLVPVEEEPDVNDPEVLCQEFAQVILEGEKVIGTLQRFVHSLNDLCDLTYPYVEHMNKMMVQLVDPNRDRESTQLEIEDQEYADKVNAMLKKPVKKILLSGSKARFYKQCVVLKPYMRVESKRRWFRFDSYSKEDRMRHLSEGVSHIAQDFMQIGILLNSAREVLDRGKRSRCKNDLIPPIKKMHKTLVKMCTSQEHLKINRKRIAEEIKNIDALVSSMEMHGRTITVQILEAVAMAHLCFNHIHQSLPVTDYSTYDTVIRDKWDEHFVSSSLPLDLRSFTKDNFYMTAYSEALRRIPAGLKGVEICLHIKAPYQLRVKIRRIQDQLKNKKQLGMKDYFLPRPKGQREHKRHYETENDQWDDELEAISSHGSHHDEEPHSHKHTHAHNHPNAELRSKSRERLSHEEKNTTASPRSSSRSTQKSKSRSRSAGRSASKFKRKASVKSSDGRKARSRFVRGLGPKRELTKAEEEKREHEKATKKWKRKLLADEEYKRQHDGSEAKLPFQELQRRALLQNTTAGRSQMSNVHSLTARGSGSSNPREPRRPSALNPQLKPSPHRLHAPTGHHRSGSAHSK